jgi:hypothetical protein
MKAAVHKRARCGHSQPRLLSVLNATVVP